MEELTIHSCEVCGNLAIAKVYGLKLCGFHAMPLKDQTYEVKMGDVSMGGFCDEFPPEPDPVYLTVKITNEANVPTTTTRISLETRDGHETSIETTHGRLAKASLMLADAQRGIKECHAAGDAVLRAVNAVTSSGGSR